MQRISLVIDTNKLDKTRIVSRTYKNKAGEEKTAKELKVDVVPLKEKRLKTSGEGWELWQVGFVTETASKEERIAKVNKDIVGEAVRFESTVKQPTFDKDSSGKNTSKEEVIDFNPF